MIAPPPRPPKNRDVLFMRIILEVLKILTPFFSPFQVALRPLGILESAALFLPQIPVEEVLRESLCVLPT